MSRHSNPVGHSPPPPPPPPRRRRNGGLSCAECRRLKLKCTREFPCASCVKRGTAAICPDGCLTTGKGNRFVLANTEVLHEKIERLCQRVRELEDALGTSHALHSATRHPLLSEELLQIKRPLEREFEDNSNSAQEVEDAEENDDDTVDTTGSLSVLDSGRTRFHGISASSWYILMQSDQTAERSCRNNAQCTLPVDAVRLSQGFPFLSGVASGAEDLRGSFLQCLPSPDEAERLVDVYFVNAGWIAQPVPQDEFNITVFSAIYHSDFSQSHSETDNVYFHKLGFLFVALAVGSALDLQREPHHPDGDAYHHLALACLSAGSAVQEPSLYAISTLMMLSHYGLLCDSDLTRWPYMGMAMRMALCLGLHRHGTKWDLSPGDAARRQRIFWELFAYEAWQSVAFGRPPSLSAAYIDCQMPHQAAFHAPDEADVSYYRWKYTFAVEVISPMNEKCFSANRPSYSFVQVLDRRICEMELRLHPILRSPLINGAEDDDSWKSSNRLVFQKHTTHSYTRIMRLYLHRGYFAKALNEYPEDPLGCKYSQSVMAAYDSSRVYLQLMNSLFTMLPDLAMRNWFLFTHCFSCAIILGSIPVKAPKTPLAEPALADLESSIRLFEALSATCPTEKILVVLRRLRGRAISSMQERGNASSRESSPQEREDEDSIDTLAGRTGLISSRWSGSTHSLSTCSEYSSRPVSLSATPPPIAPPQLLSSLTATATPLVHGGSTDMTYTQSFAQSNLSDSLTQWGPQATPRFSLGHYGSYDNMNSSQFPEMAVPGMGVPQSSYQGYNDHGAHVHHPGLSDFFLQQQAFSQSTASVPSSAENLDASWQLFAAQLGLMGTEV